MSVRRRRGTASGSLGGKVIRMLTAVGLIGAVAIIAMLTAVITPAFDRLESGLIAAHGERTRTALNDFAIRVERIARDRANDPDRAAAAPDPNATADAVLLVDVDQRIVAARWRDPAARTRLEAPLRRVIGMAGLPARLGERASTSFYQPVGDGVAAIGVARVRRATDAAPSREVVVTARMLSPTLLGRITPAATAIRVGPPTGDARARNAMVMRIRVPMTGIDGRAVAHLDYSIRRDLTLLGRQMLWLAAAGTILLLGIMLLVLRRMIGRMVLQPLARIERHMQSVRTSGTMTVLHDESRDDEIGSLVTSLNAMLRQLDDLSERVEAQSFRLGQSENAVAVMHNVRNALSPISTILSRGVAEPPVADPAVIERVAAELALADLSPERRARLGTFIATAGAAAVQARAERIAQLEIGRTALGNVLDIIGRQQTAAQERLASDSCDVTDIVARNAAIARYAGERSIAFSFPAHPGRVIANRAILSQVIGNLFANAAEAIVARGGEGGQIAVTVVSGDGIVTVTIADDGDGFDPGAAAQLFQRGYSTRAHKRGGLGLHWCANAMAAMGGTLRLVSDGAGFGAHAVLTLPAADTEEPL
jgi:signal transduction histidine kinase